MESTDVPLVVRKQFRLDDLFDDMSESSGEESIDPEILLRQARWIRDDLDPKIAQEGPEWIKPDQVVTVFKFLEHLRRSRIREEHIRYSRIHLAVALIAGQATRWPATVIDVADKLLENWSIRYGEVSEIGVCLYEQGGRLNGICHPNDISKEVLEVKWAKAPGSRTHPPFSRRHGDCGVFTPGDWWINTMFAYHAGIIDSGNPFGRIISDKHEVFSYKAKSVDSGHFRLTAATPASRQAIRVLRSHSLRSFWAPKAGLRYDGLYKVAGWSVKFDTASKAWTYDIRFKRCPNEIPMSEVLRRPFADEVDDYMEYKRMRQETRLSQNQFRRAKPLNDVSEVATRADQAPSVSHMARANAPKITFGFPATAAPTHPVPRSRLRIELPTPSLHPGSDFPISPEAQFGEALTIPSPTKAPRSPRTPLREKLKTVLPLPGHSPNRKKGTPVKEQAESVVKEDYFSLGPS